MHAAMREALGGRAGPQVCAWAMALSVQLLFVNALAAVGAFTLVVPPVMPVAAVVGGTTFGAGMVLAKG